MPNAPAIGKRLYLYQITALALILRLIVVAYTATHTSTQSFYAQASELGCLAQSLLSGHGYSSPFGGATGPSAFLAPGYPLFVALLFRIFSPFSHAAATAQMLLQACFGAATVFVTMRLARRAFNDIVANVAGLYWAINLPALFLPIIFWETSFSILSLTTLVALALVCAESPATLTWIGLGLASLIGLTVNPSLALAIAACFAWATFKAKQRTTPLTVAILCLALFSLWPLRNYRTLHAFIPLRSNMGYELWQGNRPGATGFFDTTLHLNTNANEFASYQSLGEVRYMQEKSTIAKSAIQADPQRFVALTAKRLFCFWSGYNPQSTALMVFFATLTTIGGLAGLYFLIRRRNPSAILFAIPLGLLPLPYYATHPDFRFRMVIDPLLTILAAYGITQRQSFQPRSSTHPPTPPRIP